MKGIVEWIGGALKGAALLLLRLACLCFALLGVYNASTFFVSLHAHECAEITPYTSVCLVPNQEVK